MIKKLPRYPSYTDTDIDWIQKYPSHWQLIPCRAVVDHIVEKNEGGKIQNYLSLMANVGVIRYEDKGDVGNKKPEDLSKCKIVKKGQLVINSMNYSIGSYGMSPYDGVCSSVYIILEPKKNLLNRYGLRVFENSAFQKHLATFGNGILAHRAAIGWDDIKGEYIPLAPKDEQEKILNFLDHETAQIDTLIEKQQTLIQLLKEKRQAVISHAVTKGLNPDATMKDSGVEWLGNVPEHWEVGRLKNVLRIRNGRDYKEVEVESGGYPVYGSGGIFKRSSDYLFDGESVLFGRKGTVDKPLLVSGKFWTVDTMFYSEVFSNAKPNYIYHQALLFPFDQLSTNTALPSMTQENLLELGFVIPPFGEQEQICQYLSDKLKVFSNLVSKAEQAIQLMQERRTALISAAVTGKIDVRGWVAPDGEVS